MSSTNRGALRHPDDYYATPAWSVDAILPHLPGLKTARILEPAAGDGAIVRALRLHGVEESQIEAVELDEERAAFCRMSCPTVCGDFLAQPILVQPANRAHVGGDEPALLAGAGVHREGDEVARPRRHLRGPPSAPLRMLGEAAGFPRGAPVRRVRTGLASVVRREREGEEGDGLGRLCLVPVRRWAGWAVSGAGERESGEGGKIGKRPRRRVVRWCGRVAARVGVRLGA